jgi:hypothetical protein
MISGGMGSIQLGESVEVASDSIAKLYCLRQPPTPLLNSRHARKVKPRPPGADSFG